MTYRVLPVEEWSKLDGHPVLGGHPLPPEGSTRFVVAEDLAEIVGVWALVTVLHLEPIWLAPTARNRMVAPRMWRLVKEEAKALGAKVAWAFADRDDVAGYLERLGLKLVPYRVFQYEDESCHLS